MDYLIRKLLDSFGIFFRTIKAFFSRRLAGGVARLKQLTNFSRHATKVANASFQGAAAAVKKPTKREDYIETQRLFISKSFIIYLVIGIVLVVLFCYFVAWPFILSHFLTAKFYVRDDRVSDWTGKVIVYSDKSKKTPLYSGKLEDGLLQGQGKEYDEEGLLAFEGTFVDGVKTGSGKSYASGVLVYEGGFEEGKYQGSGTLYEEGLPLYQGHFEEGIYEGAGTLFDGGTAVYEGQFHEGVYEGAGKLYSEGNVIYDGQFHEGVYEGSGTTYQNGKLAYKGTFSAGVPDGSGTMYENGVKRYEGGFAEGLFDGEGKLFFQDGTVNYKGGFAAGEYDGEGTEYREDGSVAYIGGYEAGKPSGEGTVMLENGDKIETSFADGVGDGMITWYKNGRVWYDGGADDLIPDGFGTLYAQNGKAIYEGAMDEGSIDGPWLLTLTADDLREAFADASVTESERNGGGFLMTNEDLGLTVLCTFRSDNGEAAAHRVWFFPEKGSQAGELIPWDTREEAEDWAVMGRDGFLVLTRTQGTVFVPDGGVGGMLSQSVAYFESYNQSLVSADEKSAPFGVIWALTGGGDVPVLPTVDESMSQTQKELEGLLDALDKVTAEREPTGDNNSDDGSGENPGGGTGDNPGGGTGENPGGGAGENPGGGTGENPGGGTGENPDGSTGENPGGGAGDNPGGGTGDNPGGGTGDNPGGGGTSGGDTSPAADVEGLLSRAKDMDQATKLMGALIDYCAYSQAITSLDAERPLRVKVLEEQMKLRDKGLSSDDAVSELQDGLDTLDHQLYQYNIMLEQANITVETLTGTSVEGLDLSDVLLAVNMSSVDVDRLYADALQYAKDLAAERYEVDPAEILVDVKVKLLDLTIAYDNIEQGRSTLANNQETLEKITKIYSSGQVEKADVYAAQCAVNDTVASLFQTMASYTRTFNDLNNMSGGWLAREYGWYPEPFAPLKEASIAKAQEEAKKAAGNSEEEEEAKEDTGNSEEKDGEDPGQTDGGTEEQETTE